MTAVAPPMRPATATFAAVGQAALRAVNVLGPFAAGLVVWQLVVKAWLPSYLPTPSGVVGATPTVLSSDEFALALRPTLEAMAVGLPVGVLAGLALGLLTGRTWWLRSLVAPYISGLYAVPLLALVPMITVWLGYTSDARLCVVILSALLPAAVSASDGARATPAQLVDVAVTLRLPRWRFWSQVVLPASLPYLVAGAQIAIGRVLVGIVAVEFLTNIPGLGTYILVQARSTHQDEAFVAVALIALVGVTIRSIFQQGIRRIRWGDHLEA